MTTLSQKHLAIVRECRWNESIQTVTERHVSVTNEYMEAFAEWIERNRWWQDNHGMWSNQLHATEPKLFTADLRKEFKKQYIGPGK